MAIECGLQMDLEEYMSSFSPSLMQIVASWSEGAKFMDILKGSKILEVRGIALKPAVFSGNSSGHC